MVFVSWKSFETKTKKSYQTKSARKYILKLNTKESILKTFPKQGISNSRVKSIKNFCPIL